MPEPSAAASAERGAECGCGVELRVCDKCFDPRCLVCDPYSDDDDCQALRPGHTADESLRLSLGWRSWLGRPDGYLIRLRCRLLGHRWEACDDVCCEGRMRWCRWCIVPEETRA